MKKVLLTATVQSHICQFHRPLVEVLHEAGYQVHVAAKYNLDEKNGLKLDFVDRVYNVPFSRSPKSLDNIRAFFKLKKILRMERYEVIHCNTPMGGIVTRFAALGARRKGTKVFYTAHGFHFYKGAPLKNWLVFYPIEKIMARFCDKLITITKEDYKRASKNFHTTTERIHGVGVYTDRYHSIDDVTKTQLLKAEGLSDKDFVILCVGELNKNKNQKTLISAAEKLINEIPNLIILLAGNGPLEDELRKQINDAKLGECVKLLGYRTDLEKITPAVDLVVSCSYREGLPLNIIEAELCEKPVIASINRGHKELIKEGVSGCKVKADDIDAYVKCILMLFRNPDVRIKMGKEGYRIAQKYSANSVSGELARIYSVD